MKPSDIRTILYDEGDGDKLAKIGNSMTTIDVMKNE